MISRDVSNKDNSFFLTNKIGGYTFFSSKPRSKYEGVFFHKHGKMYKVIEEIYTNKELVRIKNKLYKASRKNEETNENFFMPHGYNALVYSSKKDSIFKLFLDAKESYDNRIWGRNYKIEASNNSLIITYTKISDSREDEKEGIEEYKIYLVIKGEFDHLVNDEWEEKEYEYDKFRSDSPFKRYVYNALTIKTKKVVFGFSTSKKEAIAHANKVYKNHSSLLIKQKDNIKNIIDKFDINIPDTEIRKAHEFSINAMDSLTVKIDKSEGIFAGLPWFFQFWTRDEAICLKSLILIGKIKQAENILMREIFEIRHDGRSPNRHPPSSLGTADGAGWVFKRTEEFINILRNKHILKRFISIPLKNKILHKLEKSIYNTLKYFERDGLIYNDVDETWMDTSYGGDFRKGYRIEIQALMLMMLKLLFELTGDQKHKEREKKFREKVRTEFFIDGHLIDGKEDNTIRPNIFLAAYIYPELLEKEEWESAFDKTLPNLWLDWGGLSSIDKKHNLYCPNHIALYDQSYHRGDSWYFVNNLAAIAMLRINKEKYFRYAEEILNASAHEILYSGIIGYHAELSSASEQSSVGCLAQAWSSATFIELVNEIFGNKK